MATHILISSSPHLQRPPQPTTTSHVIIKTVTLLALLVAFVKPTSALTFNLTTFAGAASKFRFSGQGRDYRNNVTVEGGSLVLTNYSTWVTGLAIYKEPVHLWDAKSNSLADFSTHFSFVIDSKGASPKSDGIAFFLAPVGFPEPDVQEGKWFGLVGGRGRYPFVAVEFDTYQNDVDVPADHVGIDVNWRESAIGVQWKSGVLEGKLSECWVNYNAFYKVLNVKFTGFENNETVWQNLSYNINLRNVLPEFVCLGFGAATGEFPEIHKIESWSFDSKLVAADYAKNITHVE